MDIIVNGRVAAEGWPHYDCAEAFAAKEIFYSAMAAWRSAAPGSREQRIKLADLVSSWWWTNDRTNAPYPAWKNNSERLKTRTEPAVGDVFMADNRFSDVAELALRISIADRDAVEIAGLVYELDILGWIMERPCGPSISAMTTHKFMARVRECRQLAGEKK